MNELTKIDIYKSDLSRIGGLKYQITPKPTSPDLIRLLIDEHYELEKLKKILEQKNISI